MRKQYKKIRFSSELQPYLGSDVTLEVTGRIKCLFGKFAVVFMTPPFACSLLNDCAEYAQIFTCMGSPIMFDVTGSFKYLVTQCALELLLLVDSGMTLEAAGASK